MIMLRLSLILLALMFPVAATSQRVARARVTQPMIVARAVPIIDRDAQQFKDLNRNGTLDPYEDWRRSSAARAADLVSRMTLAEKAGAMMHGTARSVGPMGAAGVGTAYDIAATGALIRTVGVNSFITRLGGSPSSLASENNRLQEEGERSRLGIPITVSTDPRHHFQYVLGASTQSGQFSQWPEPLGFAALRDAALVKRFGDIARQEYRAVGIHMTLSPQADLATEPRWSRANGTFGEDAVVAGSLVQAYVEGFQHGASGVDREGVLAVVKHWVGYGASTLGFDGHNYYGRYAAVSGNALEYHARPFLGAFASNVAGVMPTYAILEGAMLNGKPIEPVGAGFNRQVLTELLRNRYHFRGVVITDWAITNDCLANCRNGVGAGTRPSFADVAMPWGVEDMPKADRFAKAVVAGVDQFGGTEEAFALIDGVKAGKISEQRVAQSAVRIMTQKFQLGLFENPYVDTTSAEQRVGTELFRAAGMETQRCAMVLLENVGDLLPLGTRRRRVFLHRIDPTVAETYGLTVVADPTNAELAIMRLDAPFETLHPGYVFGAMQHEGNLGFLDDNADFLLFKRVSAAVPTIVSIYLDRPAILTPIKAGAKAVLANFGVSDAALLDVLVGRAQPAGKLPFELPSSMADVAQQRGDIAHDTRHPLYPFGFGRRYAPARR